MVPFLFRLKISPIFSKPLSPFYRAWLFRERAKAWLLKEQNLPAAVWWASFITRTSAPYAMSGRLAIQSVEMRRLLRASGHRGVVVLQLLTPTALPLMLMAGTTMMIVMTVTLMIICRVMVCLAHDSTRLLLLPPLVPTTAAVARWTSQWDAIESIQAQINAKKGGETARIERRAFFLVRVRAHCWRSQ